MMERNVPRPAERIEPMPRLFETTQARAKLVKAELGNSYKGGEADVARGGSMCRQDVLARAKFFIKIK